MGLYQIVVDTNVLIASLRSRRGASFRLLSLLAGETFKLNVSVPLVLEYEDAAKKLVGEIHLTENDIDDILDYICTKATHRKIYYLWRPFLKDPKDDMVLELAVASRCDFLVTYNKDDFKGIERFGLQAVTAREFLQKIGELP
jgi:putative PIN family toxin of toxin-antitoxin system